MSSLAGCGVFFGPAERVIVSGVPSSSSSAGDITDTLPHIASRDTSQACPTTEVTAIGNF